MNKQKYLNVELHVLSSIREFECAIEAIKEFKTILIGIHISEGTRLPI